jgi:hypothetical protein
VSNPDQSAIIILISSNIDTTTKAKPKHNEQLNPKKTKYTVHTMNETGSLT